MMTRYQHIDVWRFASVMCDKYAWMSLMKRIKHYVKSSSLNAPWGTVRRTLPRHLLVHQPVLIRQMRRAGPRKWVLFVCVSILMVSTPLRFWRRHFDPCRVCNEKVKVPTSQSRSMCWPSPAVLLSTVYFISNDTDLISDWLRQICNPHQSRFSRSPLYALKTLGVYQCQRSWSRNIEEHFQVEFRRGD